MDDAKDPQGQSGLDQRRWFDDLRVGDSLRTRSTTITEQQIFEFAKLYDAQWFHLDRERASSSILGGLSASGFQTASLLWGLTVETGYFKDISVAGLGLDALKWTKPFYAGDTLHAVLTVLELRESKSRPDCGIACIRYEGVNQKGETIISYKMSQMLLRRPK